MDPSVEIDMRNPAHQLLLDQLESSGWVNHKMRAGKSNRVHTHDNVSLVWRPRQFIVLVILNIMCTHPYGDFACFDIRHLDLSPGTVGYIYYIRGNKIFAVGRPGWRAARTTWQSKLSP